MPTSPQEQLKKLLAKWEADAKTAEQLALQISQGGSQTITLMKQLNALNTRSAKTAVAVEKLVASGAISVSTTGRTTSSRSGGASSQDLKDISDRIDQAEARIKECVRIANETQERQRQLEAKQFSPDDLAVVSTPASPSVNQWFHTWYPKGIIVAILFGLIIVPIGGWALTQAIESLGNRHITRHDQIIGIAGASVAAFVLTLAAYMIVTALNYRELKIKQVKNLAIQAIRPDDV